MNVLKQKDGTYNVESASSKGKFYNVDPNKPFCSCPGYIFRYRKSGDICKHIKAVKEMLNKKNETGTDEILAYIREKETVDSIELIEKFGEDKLNYLIEKGDILEERGIIRLLK